MTTLSSRKDKLNRAVDQEIDFHILYSTFANNVKYIRKQLDMTQQQFAHLLGWQRSIIGMVEEGRSLDLKRVMIIAKTARVSIDTILLTDMRKPIIHKGVSEAAIKAEQLKEKLIKQNTLLNAALKSIELANIKLNQAQLNASNY